MEFNDTVPLSAPPARLGPTPAVPPAASGPAVHSERPLRIEFTGSGSEYFRIWIVNLLLTLVTASLYYPFAKARRLRYFHANTLVDGHALGFHGDPVKMLRGYLLMVGFAMTYAAAGRFSATAGLVAVLAFGALWPALWLASLRFRLANTSWRGLRLRFTGSLDGAYAAMLPALVMMALVVALGPRGDEPAAAAPGGLRAALFGLAVLGAMALSPLALARVKRFQHGHYRFAAETTTLNVPTRRFYALWAMTGLLALLAAVPLVAVVAAMFATISRPGAGAPGWAAAVPAAIVLFYAALFVLTQPYAVSRLQNLVWGGTRSSHLRFESALRFRSLAWLTAKNLLLVVLTLGLYRPFAVVATTRMRLAALALHVSGDIDQWTADAAARQGGDAAGDAAGDLLGVDLGL